MNKRYSKFLSLVLRHQPETLGLTLDEAGWAPVDELLQAATKRDRAWSRELLDEVVHTNTKQRFEFSPDGTHIRARQGHSVEVDLGYEPEEPPEFLFHGTVKKYLDAIFEGGLQPMSRHHVHLSPDLETATIVGSRRGKPVLLRVAAKRMHAEGHEFMHTENDVWLVAGVPAEFIDFGAEAD